MMINVAKRKINSFIPMCIHNFMALIPLAYILCILHDIIIWFFLELLLLLYREQ